jgi:hypothetical protein
VQQLADSSFSWLTGAAGYGHQKTAITRIYKQRSPPTKKPLLAVARVSGQLGVVAPHAKHDHA